MKIVTTAEMRAIDRATSERFGVPSLTLMEHAGAAVADFALTTYPATGRTGVICGKGNNAGDGLWSREGCTRRAARSACCCCVIQANCVETPP